MERWGCLTVSLETEIFLPGKEAPETGRYTTQNSCRKSLKLTRAARPLPAQAYISYKNTKETHLDYLSCLEEAQTQEEISGRGDTLQPLALL